MSHLVLPDIECVESTETYGKFIAEPLERSFGVTLGNSLRRVLLGSLRGAAVTWVKIEGVQHELASIPCVKEDVADFLLNVKALRLRPLSDHPGRLYLEMEGEGRVCAVDIKPSADFEIVNPELHLATLDSAEARLFVEFNVELGKGFVPATHSNGLPIGVIPVDAIFTPVYKVNYATQPARISQQAGYEELVLEIWTDGTISAVEALSSSAQLLVEQFSPFVSLTKPPGKEELPLAIPPEQYNMLVEKLGLSSRTLNSLRRGKINKVGELLEMTGKELLSIKKFGKKSLKEVQQRLEALGLPPIAGVEAEEPSLLEQFEEMEAEEEEGL